MENKGKRKNVVIAFVILGVLLLAAISYVVFDVLRDVRAARESQIYEDGAAYGYELAVSEIARLAGSCQKVPITYMNETMELADLSCLTV